MSVEIPPPTAAAEHFPCLKCGYDLFGMPAEANCPECGDAVGPSLNSFQAGVRMRLDSVASPLVWMAIFSGLSVGSCFLFVRSPDTIEPPIAITIVFGFLFFAAVKTTIAIRKAVDPTRLIAAGFDRTQRLDTAASIGLLLVLASIWIVPLSLGSDLSPLGAGAGGIGFLVLGATSYRFRLFYSLMASLVLTRGQRRLANAARTLGMVKFLVEGLWLGGCMGPGLLLVIVESDFAIPFLIAGFFGCLVYGAIWIAMIAIHSRLAQSFATRSDGQNNVG